MKKKLMYLIILVFSTLTLIGCGKEDGEDLAEANKNSIIQFNEDIIEDNTMYVVEGYIYSTFVRDYVIIDENTNNIDINVTSIECPDGKKLSVSKGASLDMFKTYDAYDEPYIVHFEEKYTGDTNILQVYCLTEEDAVEKGVIESVIPFTFKDFIVDNQLNIIANKEYSENFEDYIETDTYDTIEITTVYKAERDENKRYSVNDFRILSFNKEMRDMYLPNYISSDSWPENATYFTYAKVTISDTARNHSVELYINVYPEDTDPATTGVLFAPTLE